MILLTDEEINKIRIQQDCFKCGHDIAKAQLRKVAQELQGILDDDKWVNNVRSGIEQLIASMEKELD